MRGVLRIKGGVLDKYIAKIKDWFRRRHIRRTECIDTRTDFNRDLNIIIALKWVITEKFSAAIGTVHRIREVRCCNTRIFCTCRRVNK